ncbi:MAG: LysR family transcriptional regulator [Akkermansiaceae bacterium]
MEINQLFYFRALHKEGSFAKAAEHCSISQPSLSLQIKKLEDELGEQLVIRSRKGCRLTTAGETFWLQAHKILQHWEETLQIFTDRNELHKQVLRIGAIPTIAPYLIPQKISHIRSQLKDINFDISEDKSSEMIARILSDEIDFGICSSLPTLPSGIQLERLFSEPLHVILPNQPTYTSLTSIKELKQEKLILLKDGHCLSDQTVSQCRAINIHSKGTVRCENIETLVGLVESDLGYGVIPQMALKNYAKRNIHIPKFSDSHLEREVNIISKADKLFDTAERSFIKLLLT